MARRSVRSVAGIAVAILVLVALGAGWRRYRALEELVTAKFAGRLWAIPSRVYSDAFPLYPGLGVDGTGLFARLRRLGYRELDGPVRVRGDVWRHPGGDAVDLYLHAFRYPSHREDGRLVRLELRDDVITRVVSLEDGAEVFDVALEPEQLAGLYEHVWKSRQVVALEEIPPRLVQAVLVVEDRRFFAHGAIDWRGVARALVRNLAAGRIVEGGSTLTQQLMKNFFLSEARTVRRKLTELVMAVITERRYPKEQILSHYLNEIYLGQSGARGVFGVAEAGEFYFGKAPSDLTTGEMALLAGLIRAPNYYSPFRDPERARARRDLVLTRMEATGVLRPSEAAAAQAEPITLRAQMPERAPARYFVDFVRRELGARYPPEALTDDGLRIFTSLDAELQHAAETAVTEGLEELEKTYPKLARSVPESALQAALVALHPATGEIKAMVGGRDYRVTQFNRVADARRQPGSIFKPIVYFAALDPTAGRGHLLPTTWLEDVPFSWSYDGRAWRPANYNDRYLGRVSVRQALEESLNAATARVAYEIGLPRVVRTAEALGFPGPLPALPAIVLGGHEVTPLAVAEIYAVFASLGQRTASRAVTQVADEDDRLIEGRPLAITSVISPAVSYLVTHILEGVFERGTAASARARGFRVPAAGKTGTTNDYRDAWFVGYTPDLVAVVWVGFDHDDALGLSGSRAALPIWTAFMESATAGRAAREFEVPPGVRLVPIDPASGRRATAACPERLVEAFLESDAPRDPCPLHGGYFHEPMIPRPAEPERPPPDRRPWWERLFG